MMNRNRRKFIRESALLGTAAAMSWSFDFPAGTGAGKPACLGGTPLMDDAKWPTWPKWVSAEDEGQVLEVLRSGIWSRADVTTDFENRWAETIGTKRCLTVVNGTNALITALANFGVGAGDEVIVPPYTFIATIMAVLAQGAMPVFVDVELDTFLMDPARIEEKITPRTKAIIPVHIAGLPVDMDRIMAIAEKHQLVLIEDACQAHLAEYDGKPVGSIGHAGCFSFQNSKNMAIGEGGAITSNDDAFIDKCYSYHNLGLPYGSAVGSVASGSVIVGTKVRFTEYQAAIGLAMLKRVDAETTLRNENASYLQGMLAAIPGIAPYRLYDKVTRAAFHLFPFRLEQEDFKGLSREQFIKALNAEGVPCSSGYATLTDKPYLRDAFAQKRYQEAYPAEQLDFDAFVERNRCVNDGKLCNGQAVWFTQNMLLGTRADMERIAEAVKRIYNHADTIKKT
ncbi:DegT/DnrJ/EryC1/StrS family aminotransferase [Olivibacter sp. SDN3]|uniref:DegT/DnrJ/EryC1/StrS family aminotransferase n=1 Tax=Olivibacter sp. SDN3 TaxID=2764720 RepID=UPI001651035D|nr:DegT/DnrJ/EryC1/StrS family aminotransferase [Olivibacter sp. SDN3]QNL51974.1 DegT/DnrJ/EryC1/StrS family aminotransferase [Olivibacter sp. SDN3]